MFKKILPLLLFASPLAAQVQYEIIDLPVCWNDSSLIKYVYVTTSGAYADLGYYNAEGLPVTVTGTTPTPGFCADALTIDSTAARAFTITLGDQTVTWVDSVGGGGVDKLADLLDVDTAGLTDQYILKYNNTAQEWEVKENNIDGLTDGRNYSGWLSIGNKYTIGNTGADNVFFTKNANDTLANTTGTSNTAIGYNAMRLGVSGSQNTVTGRSAMVNLLSGSNNTASGALSGWGNKTGSNNTYGGYYANALDSIGSNNTMFGDRVNTFGFDVNYHWGRVNADSVAIFGANSRTKDTISTNEIIIGAFVIGNGSNTATLGNNNITATYLKGTTNLSGYGLGNKEAGDLSKTQSAYIAAFSTDGTLIELDTTAISQGGITQITGFNALTDVGADSVKLGGTLIENTAINMDSFEITYTNNGGTFISGNGNIGFTTNTDSLGNSAFAMGNLGTRFSNDYGDSLALHTVNLASARSGVRELDLRSEKSNNNDVYTMIALSPERFAMKTPNVVNLTATPGMFLKLVNQATGEVEFDTIAGGGGGGFTLPTDSITFNDNTGAAVAGKLQRDDNTGALVYGSPTGTELRLQPPGWYVKNQTGSTIPRGTVVRAAGTVGNSDQILIDLMLADGSIEAKYLLGVTAENIADGADGWVFSQGKIKPLDLSAYNSGEVLYVSTTVPGALTDTLPTAPDLVLPLGFVVDSTSNGTLAVRVTFNPTVTATNGLTATSGADNTEVKLGGDLIETTKIDGTHNYGLWLDSLSFLNAYARGDIRLRADSTTFGTNSALTFDDFTGASLTNFGSTNKYTSTLFLGRTAALELKQTREFGGVNYENGFRVNASDVTSEIYSQNKDSLTLITSIKLSPEKLIIRTPNINDTISSPGEVLSLIDSTTGEVDYLPLNKIESDTAQVIDFENLPQKIYQWDFTGKSTATASFNNVKTGAIYVIHVINSTAGDIITWPVNTKTETGATLTSTTLSGTGRIFTFYYDKTNYYLK